MLAGVPPPSGPASDRRLRARVRAHGLRDVRAFRTSCGMTVAESARRPTTRIRTRDSHIRRLAAATDGDLAATARAAPPRNAGVSRAFPDQLGPMTSSYTIRRSAPGRSRRRARARASGACSRWRARDGEHVVSRQAAGGGTRAQWDSAFVTSHRGRRRRGLGGVPSRNRGFR
jgi:hypothetical protein